MLSKFRFFGTAKNVKTLGTTGQLGVSPMYPCV
jgi:hypothetical protein